MELESCLSPPSEWRKVSIASVCKRFTSGGTPSRKKLEYFEGGVLPWIKTKELADCVVGDAEEWITEEAIAYSSAKRLPRNTLLMAMYGATVGQLGVLGREMACNQACAAMVVDDTLCDFRFLYYQLLGNRRQIVSMATGAAQQNLSGAQIKTWVLPLPSRGEQSRICHVLWSIDERIALLRRTNATLEAIAQALFKSWFVDFDPVRAKAEGREPEGMDAVTAALFPSEFEDSKLGPIPKGWSARALDSIANYLNGLALQKYPPESDSEFLPVIKIAQLRAGHTRGADRASARLKPGYVVEDGDVLFSWSGSLEVETWGGGRGALNQHLFKVTSTEVPKWFYYLATRHHLPAFRETAAHKATTMGHIQRRHLTEALVAVPPGPLMKVLSETAAPLLDACLNNALRASSLEGLRDTLLPRLISGKLRLPEADAEVEALS
ncbi:restriction endonuclease subunit S [Lysobacter zhanggongensis]|uniref:Restriction endonuclease subunit S n=1 Tax=Lysobacter zhanggongensis TaxID=1774951 RepID=A0ABU7YQ35_9GAMM